MAKISEQAYNCHAYKALIGRIGTGSRIGRWIQVPAQESTIGKMSENHMKMRSFFVFLLSCGALIGILLLSGCGDTGAASKASPLATVTYLPPTVVPNTPVPTATIAPTATATPRPPSRPQPTAVPAAVPPGPSPVGTVPNISGQLILVSLSQQWLFAYQDHRLVYRSAVTTGMPQLPTPTGTYHIRWHEQNVTFYSPWPQGSPYYYSPEHINYAMYYADYGYYIHDAPWRETFGPGTNYPHTEPDGTTATGSHGCTNMPTKAAQWLYYWAHDGATVVIYGTAPVPPPATATPVKPTPTKTPAPAPTATATATPIADPTATATATP